MNAQIAKIISAITAPPLIMVAAIFLLVVSGGRMSEAFLGAIFIVGGGILPFALFLATYLTTKGDKFNPDREHREPIFLTGALTYGFLIVLFSSSLINSPFWAHLSTLTSLLLMLLYLIDHYFDKASVHAAIFVFWVLVLVAELGDRWSLALLALPFIIWSRISLKQHTWAQVLWGMCLGMVIGILSWMLLA